MKMTTAQVAETSVTVNNSPIQDYDLTDDHTQLTYEMIPGFKPFTKRRVYSKPVFFTNYPLLNCNCQYSNLIFSLFHNF